MAEEVKEIGGEDVAVIEDKLVIKVMLIS